MGHNFKSTIWLGNAYIIIDQNALKNEAIRDVVDP